jgi:hypothetical protein
LKLRCPGIGSCLLQEIDRLRIVALVVANDANRRRHQRQQIVGRGTQLGGGKNGLLAHLLQHRSCGRRVERLELTQSREPVIDREASIRAGEDDRDPHRLAVP